MTEFDEYTKLSPLYHSASVNDEKFLLTFTKTSKHLVNAKDKMGNTAMHYAAFNRNKKYIEVLIKEGANVKLENDQGNTALHLAWLNNDPHKDHSSEVEELLIDSGAEINVQNDKIKNPLMLLFRTLSETDEEVCHNKFDPISSVIILIKAETDVTASTTNDMIPLHYTWVRGATISALTLINNGLIAKLKITIYNSLWICYQKQSWRFMYILDPKWKYSWISNYRGRW